MLVFCKSCYKLLLNLNFVCICIRRVFINIVEYIKAKSRITNYSNNCKVLLLNHFVVIAGELEGSWRAGGQQEGLQYNVEAAG